MSFVSIESFIEASLACENSQDLFEIFIEAVEPFGFDRLLLGLLTEHPRFNKPPEYGLLHNFPSGWLDHYCAQNYVLIDPVRHHLYCSHSLFSWRSLYQIYSLTPKQKQLLHEAREANLKSGVGIPLRSGGGALAGVVLASSNENVAEDVLWLARVNLITQQFYARFCSLMEADMRVERVSLTEKEIEILKWLACGKTKSEVADKLCLSAHTVSFHVRNINNKFDVHNVTAAVARAMNKGLIQL